MLRLCCNKIDWSFIHSFIHSWSAVFLVLHHRTTSELIYLQMNVIRQRNKGNEVSRFLCCFFIRSFIFPFHHWPWIRIVWRIFFFLLLLHLMLHLLSLKVCTDEFNDSYMIDILTRRVTVSIDRLTFFWTRRDIDWLIY